MTERDQLVWSMERRVEAVRAKDVEALLALYDDDVETFDLVAPLVSNGIDAVRRRVETWFASFATPIGYTIADVNLSVEGRLAYDHHLTHVSGTNTSGDAIAMWFRETVGYRRTADRWLVVHQHTSVPFDMETGKPLLQLRPGDAKQE